MKFHLIHTDHWKRKPYFDHYLNHVKCTFDVTVQIDITLLFSALQKKKIKFYPAFIYMLTKTIHSRVEFRTAFNEEGQLGYWETMIPKYTIFHKDDHTFSTLWTTFSNDFPTFYKNYLADLQQYGSIKGISAKPIDPANHFNISSVPWISFTGFHLNLPQEDNYLLPIITGGKYIRQLDQLLLPVSVQMHHAVCDGYHASLFFQELQSLANQHADWLS